MRGAGTEDFFILIEGQSSRAVRLARCADDGDSVAIHLGLPVNNSEPVFRLKMTMALDLNRARVALFQHAITRGYHCGLPPIFLQRNPITRNPFIHQGSELVGPAGFEPTTS